MERLELRGCFVQACAVVLALASAVACHGGPDAALTKLLRARALAAELRVQFSKGANASDRAVMAESDEASIASAREAERTASAIQRDTTALAARLGELGYTNESRLLGDFEAHYAKYRELDRSVLELSVENTNLKAQRLAFGPAQQAANAARDALERFASEASPQDRCRIDALVAKAVSALREIQVLQAPHIAEAEDAAMTRLEKQMAGLQASARDAMNALAGPVESTARPAALSEAFAAFDRFTSVSSEIVKLSRRNSNVRSLSLSLARKPALIAACDASLIALADALANEGSSATR